MAIVTKTTLKSYFEQGDIPTQAQYVDLIDSQLGLGESGTTQIIQGVLSASSAEVEQISFKKLYIPGNGVGSMKIGTTFSIGQTLEVSGSINVTDGDITITGSGTIDVQNATITTLSSTGSISASGNVITSNITSSGNISSSGTITANKIEASNLVGHAGDPDTEIAFSSDTVNINANSIQQAKFSSTQLLLGNSSTATAITGSRITFSTAPSSSNGIYVGGNAPINFINPITASAGINVTTLPATYDLSWSNGLELEVGSRRTFQVLFSNFPEFGDIKQPYSSQTMILVNTEINVNSIVICQQATILSSQATYIKVEVWNVNAGRAVLRLKNTTPSGLGGEIEAEGRAIWNFTIL
jgi:hypothetical protein